ncbi:MAG: hypothetical protein ACYC8T_11215 [Myxococcaceae bacterium]
MATALASKRPPSMDPASIAEFELSGQDEEVLREWALNVANARAAFTSPAEFGLLFLAATSISARTQATPHRLWPNVHHVFGEASEVFEMGYPVYAVRAALLAAVNRYGLRHVFFRNLTTQHWYATVLLQIAWTHDTIERLPEWLAGSPLPLSLDLLLRDPALRSASFAETFDGLRKFRRGSISEVRSSVWLRGDLHRLGSTHARRLPELGTSSETDNDPVRAMLSVAGNGVPEFRMKLSVTDEIADRRPVRLRYFIDGSQRVERRAIRQESGIYSFTEDSVSVGFASGPLRCRADWSVHGEILDDGGTSLWSDELQLVDPSREVELFVPASDGLYRRVEDAWEAEVSSDRPAVVATAADIEVSGASTGSTVDVGGMRWFVIPKGQLAATRATLGGELFWAPLLRAPPKSSARDRADRLTDEWRPGADITWSYRPPPGGTVKRALLAGRVLEIHRNGLTYVLRLPKAGALPSRFTARLTVETAGQDEVRSVDLRPPRVRGLLAMTAAGLAPISGFDQKAFATPLSFLWGDEDEAAPYLFEGNRPISPLPRRPRVVRELAGLGAPLRVVDGRYNAHLRPSLYHHDAGVIQAGVIARAERTSTGAVLELTQKMEWKPGEFRVDCMLGSGRVVKASSRTASSGGSIVVSTQDQPAACVVFFGPGVVARHAWQNAGSAIERAVKDAQLVGPTINWLLNGGLPVERADLHRALVGGFAANPQAALLSVVDAQAASESASSSGVALDLLREAESSILSFLSLGSGYESAVVDLMNAVEPPAAEVHRLQYLFRKISSADPITAGFVLLLGAIALGTKAPGRPKPGEKHGNDQAVEALGRRLVVDARFLAHHMDQAVSWVMDLKAPPMTTAVEVQRLLQLSDFRFEAARAIENAVLAKHGSC